ncbi:TlpA family protein disulfide reductase [Micromonospora peucetia]|uniref:Thiol-disulfide isomerase or thioredoxin n=1 Tax=Micromonospora peucetia TaxID=47871 RepID=A0A1C6V258_9ACTN|nr:TlpA disulfide reductase family protein [Micromonospora peucetia]MCX4389043.1 TlpA family protein disulfide reductase [Micromonospora peucetia]WSA35250.1 TlpA family protein disulfide reductase [Micromonospora peucetia]SCL60419.1 Thiol-disulfide isomerase or thioredoxin [Micromonospora peucetia]
MNRRLAALLVPVLLAVAGCTAGTEEKDPGPSDRQQAAANRPSPFQDCSALGTPPASAAPAPPSGAGGQALPELTLNCFTGGAPVALRDVRGPAVINVWASWCPPCRKELPAFQRLSERAAGRLHVIGVNNQDSREAAKGAGEDFGLRFPVLFDQGESFKRALRAKGIPVTVFVDGQGRVRHVDSSGALDDARLAELVRQHLGLTVPT